MTRLLCACLVAGAAALVSAQGRDLDAFMETVVARRDENWKKLQQYVLEERETFALTGSDGARLYGARRDYSWFINQGVFVRSPLRVDGATVGERDRRKYEAEWIAREKRRDARAREGTPDTVPRDAEPSAEDLQAVLRSAAEPRFISAAYFLRFKFEPGQYALVGRERIDGRELLQVEYYPRQMFREGRARPGRRLRERDEAVAEKMNKVSLITLWIDDAARQIVRYTFDDIDMDFLPGRSLVRMRDLKAEMRMHEPFPEVWLPQSIAITAQVALAAGVLQARYDVDYHDYRQASVGVRVK